MNVIPKGTRLTAAQQAELEVLVKARYAAGDSMRQIAEQTGRSYGSINRLVRLALDTQARGRGGNTRQRPVL